MNIEDELAKKLHETCHNRGHSWSVHKVEAEALGRIVAAYVAGLETDRAELTALRKRVHSLSSQIQYKRDELDVERQRHKAAVRRTREMQRHRDELVVENRRLFELVQLAAVSRFYVAKALTEGEETA